LLTRIAERCKAVGLLVKVNEQPSSDGSRGMTCSRKAGDEFALGVSVAATTPTEVMMGEDIED
jgi:hypothetical protein